MAINNKINITLDAKDNASSKFRDLDKSASGLWSRMQNMKWPLKALWIAIAAAWAAAWAAWFKVLKMWANLEQTQIAFETMLWSAELAKETLEWLTNFAKRTPFEVTWIRDTAKQLLAFGFSADELLPTLKSLWDVSAWLSVPIEQVAYAYWQVRAANQLYWTELRQFVNAWIPILAELADMYWVTAAEAKKMVEDWLVWFDDVEEAFTRMTSEWWRFEDLMAKQSLSLAWMVSNLKDSFTALWETVWLAIIPVFKELLVEFQPIIEKTAESTRLWFENKDNIAKVTNTIKWLVNWIKIVFKIIWTLISILYKLWEALWFVAFKVVELAWRVRDWFNTMVNVISQKWNAIKSMTSSVWNAISSSVISIASSIYNAVVGKFSAMIDKVSWIYNKIKGFLSSIFWAEKTANQTASRIQATNNQVASYSTPTYQFSWARANWWDVWAWKSYLVGERWPELFTPGESWSITSNRDMWKWWVTLSFWDVNISNWQTEKQFFDKVKKTMIEVQRTSALWF